MGELLSCLQKIFIILPFITDDVFHVRLSDPIDSSNTSNMELDSTKDNSVNFAEAFIFDNGTFATWGASHQEIEKLLKVVKQVEVNRYSSVETEWFSYCVDLSQPGGLIGDLLVIGHDLPQHQSKLAFSAGLTRSVKLASLEEQLDKHLNKHKHIPEILLKGKKLPLSRSKVLQNLGELFSLRGQVNLHSELLDSPDFCWSTTKMEDYFDRISRNLDVRPRIAICNKKLDYANELAEVLRNHLHEEHSIRLEWIIIILISVEIVFNVIEYCERHFNNKNS
ncbi:hypothetical protein HK099_003151 [Clydaea vesicula]|uniref:DUF155 domain-containing protein n=1 Tax=Clydaea vesicula TaxID=447962 RepID=A0AAD5U1W7_9FUNG|nr:hypothetical protein HK099_003151 [Clydaea vesicula]KAJ3384843.1 hypothetical protein HDU92_003358 [Lobulomyces angularis]